jgi:hypothetical protein
LHIPSKKKGGDFALGVRSRDRKFNDQEHPGRTQF